MKIIGVIGGMGPLATADLYKKIIYFTVAEKDQDHSHVIIDSNPKIPDRTDYILHKGPSPIPEIVKSIRRLEAAGCDFLIMPCNTAHTIIEEIKKTTKVPFLNMMEETAKYVAKKHPGEIIGLLATDGTVYSGAYHKYLEKEGVKVVTPSENQEKVMDFIFKGVKSGNVMMSLKGIEDAVKELTEKGASVILLGCTELSAVSDRIKELDYVFVDPLDILAHAAVIKGGKKAKEV